MTADPLTAWIERFGTAVVLANSSARPTDIAALTTVLADKPDAGLPTEWWTLIAAVEAWVEQVEKLSRGRGSLPPLRVGPQLLAALDAPPRPRHAWQDRADA